MHRLTFALAAAVAALLPAGAASSPLVPPTHESPAAGAVAPQAASPAQADLARRVDELDARIDRMQDRVRDGAGGAVLFLYGAFCALWARNSGRSAWGWFFLGLVFSVITVLVLLYKNAEDRDREADAARPASP
jgi:hypothetical protein